MEELDQDLPPNEAEAGAATSQVHESTIIQQALDTVTMTSSTSQEIGSSIEHGNVAVKKEHTTETQLDQLQSEEHNAYFSNLQRATEEESVHVLDNCKDVSLEIIDDISKILTASKESRDVTPRLRSLQSLKHKTQTPKFTLGVFGSSGYGKSSVINALLDQGRLVPTSCMRACTAVITEISWNTSNGPRERYVAQIEFISAEEWLRELETIFEDLANADGSVSRDSISKGTDAGVAWAKIKAVYPGVTKDTLPSTDAKSLVEDPAVKTLLGTTHKKQHAEADAFYNDIQGYVNSGDTKKARPGKKKFEDLIGEERRMHLWPLIKIVRIYTRADVLSTGAVIVDLPGGGDSNVARSAIASRYIKECDAIWVVAPITRAATDKAAKDLLGLSFKQQLKLDGNYSKVTFICTKTDDINMEEAASDLGLDDELETHTRSLRALDRWESELDKQISHWEKLEMRCREGDVVKSASMIPIKRKGVAQRTSHSKRSRTDPPGANPDVSSYASAQDVWESINKDMPSFPEDQALNEDQLRSVLDHLRSKKGQAFEEQEALEQKINEGLDDCAKLSEAYDAARSKLLSLCISSRNEVSRDAIRKDFAIGLKELDEANLQRENPELYDPEEELRDYDEVEGELPVFCVSSRAYQALIDPLGKDEQIEAGFKDVDATEIPQLRAHAIELTKAGRISKTKSLLLECLQQLNSLHVWSSTRHHNDNLSDDERDAVMSLAKSSLTELHKDLTEALEEFVRKCRKIIRRKIFDHFQWAVEKAISEAPQIALTWVQGEASLGWSSYRKACKNRGEYRGTLPDRDFNEELEQPLKACFANSWTNTFERRIPRALDEFSDKSAELLQTFQHEVEGRIQKKPSFKLLTMLRAQLRTRVDAMKCTTNSFKDDITTIQREADRNFRETIQANLGNTYAFCGGESGRGCFLRLQQRMREDLRDRGYEIFGGTTDPVKARLLTLCNTTRLRMESMIAQMLDDIDSDFTSIIQGSDTTASSKWVREGVAELLRGVDSRFEQALQHRDEAGSSDDVVFQHSNILVLDEDASVDPNDHTQDVSETDGLEQGAEHPDESGLLKEELGAIDDPYST